MCLTTVVIAGARERAAEEHRVMIAAPRPPLEDTESSKILWTSRA
jgi:hypothetical protein